MYKEFLIILTLKHVDSSVRRHISGHVLGGDYTRINKYPHAVYLDVISKVSCICGGSILTQDIVLSAAHCFENYLGRKKKDSVIINYGASTLQDTLQNRMKYYRLHDKYDEFTMYGDISILLLEKPIKLGKYVKRVAIMTRAPKESLAYVAGWGIIDNKHNWPKGLKDTKQEVRDRRVCTKHISLPKGTFCAGPFEGEGHPAGGDSGGALVIKHFIQIGIVSFKEEISSLVVYTNVSYHYAWIKENAAWTYCARS